ncbi:MAG: peptidase, partial [Rhodothermales bacterium]|nr:peptidase [Rhodothermales bacterium]
LVEALDGSNTTLLLTSDHGNLEDLSVKTHTRNPVPFVALGPAAHDFAEVRSILDVTPAILRSLGSGD